MTTHLDEPIVLRAGEAIVIRASATEPGLTVLRAEDIPPGGTAILKAFGTLVLEVRRE